MLNVEFVTQLGQEERSSKMANFSNNSNSPRELESPIPYPVTVAIVLPNIAGNILCCVVIAKTKSLHNFCNFLLVNLAISDMLAGLVELLVCTCEQLNFSLGGDESTVLKNVKLFVHPMIQVSILTVTVISVERFLAITQPFKVMRKGRVKNLKIIIPFVWILGFVLNVPVFVIFFGKSEEEIEGIEGSNELMVDGIFYLVSAYIAPLFLMIFTFFRMLFVLKRRNQSFKSQQSLRNTRSRANQRVWRLLGAVILSHNICFLPYAIVQFMVTQPFGFNIWEKTYTNAYYATSFLQLLSPCLNPLIYFAHSRVFRDACKNILCRSIKVKP